MTIYEVLIENSNRANEKSKKMDDSKLARFYKSVADGFKMKAEKLTCDKASKEVICLGFAL